MRELNRRDFFALSAAAGAATLAGCATTCGTCGKKSHLEFGVCIGGSLNDVPLLKAAGYDYFEGSVGPTLIPEKDDAAWTAQRAKLLAAPLPVRSCNGFLPGSFKLTGPDKILTWNEALAYARTACVRADEVGMKAIVFGSGSARNAPDGWEKGKAVEQFTEFCRRLADRISDCKVTVVLEPLCKREANYLNYVWEGLEIVEKVGSPRLLQLADFYHMNDGDESEGSILEAGDRLAHCHVATPLRKAPGLSDAGRVPAYFEALRKIGYRGGVSIEAAWDFKGKSNEERHLQRVKALELMKGWAAQ